jgi:hypothetical protein
MPYFYGLQCQKKKEYEANVTVAMNARFTAMLQMAYASLVRQYPSRPTFTGISFHTSGQLGASGNLKNTSLPAVQNIHQ